MTYAKLGRDARQKLISAATKQGAGSPGPAGPQGPQGPAGNDGVPGTNGATDIIIRRTSAPVGSGQTADLYIPCQPGGRAVSGGGRLGLYGAGNLDYSFPIGTGNDATMPKDMPAVGWDVGVYNNTGFAQTAYGFAACARS